MSQAYSRALAAVMELPEEEWLAVRDAIEESVMDEKDDALFAELERRRAEHEFGRDPVSLLMSCSELFAVKPANQARGNDG